MAVRDGRPALCGAEPRLRGTERSFDPRLPACGAAGTDGRGAASTCPVATHCFLALRDGLGFGVKGRRFTRIRRGLSTPGLGCTERISVATSASERAR